MYSQYRYFTLTKKKAEIIGINNKLFIRLPKRMQNTTNCDNLMTFAIA